MSETVKIFTLATVPLERQKAWLQHLRDFDVANPGCEFEIAVDVPDKLVTAEMLDRINVEPNLTFTKIFDRTKWRRPDGTE